MKNITDVKLSRSMPFASAFIRKIDTQMCVISAMHYVYIKGSSDPAWIIITYLLTVWVPPVS